MGIICLKYGHKSSSTVQTLVRNVYLQFLSFMSVQVRCIISVFYLNTWQVTPSALMRWSCRSSLPIEPSLFSWSWKHGAVWQQIRLHFDSDIQMLLISGPNRLTHLQTENWGYAINHECICHNFTVFRVISLRQETRVPMNMELCLICKTPDFNGQQYFKI